MVTIREYLAPETIEEAYEILMEAKTNTILGGLGFLKMGTKPIGKGIDLCNLSLDYIKETDQGILIGADTSLRELEINEIIRNYCGGVISQGVSNIVGVQFRNMAKVGASVFSKYGFSDILPSLLVLDAKVKLFKGGVIDIEDFLNKEYEKDILTEVILPKKKGIATFECIRKSSTDLPVLNAALYKGDDGEYKLAYGARPQRGILAKKAAEALENSVELDKVSEIILEEVHFGSNYRGSKEYREAMSKSLLEKMISKVGE